MPSVTRLALNVAAKVWPVVTARSRQGWQWLRRNPLWSASGIVAVTLLILLITHWNAYKKQREAFTPIFTLAAGLAIAGVTLMRHFAQTDADRQRRIIESFSKAIEQLGSDKLEVRLGGIYALERISQESPRDYWTVMENLTAFVRERTRRTEAERLRKPLDQRLEERAYSLWENAGRPEGRHNEFWAKAEAVEEEKLRDPPATDIAAVLTVIKRRSEDDRAQEAREQRALDFREVVLRGADLREAHLKRTYLFGAHLEGADLTGAYLEGANLTWAHLEGARLEAAHLEGANLTWAHLEGADLRRAEGLTQAQIDGAYGDVATTLPEGLTRPAHWLEPKGGSAPAA
jgi:hypothetical protein